MRVEDAFDWSCETYRCCLFYNLSKTILSLELCPVFTAHPAKTSPPVSDEYEDVLQFHVNHFFLSPATFKQSHFFCIDMADCNLPKVLNFMAKNHKNRKPFRLQIIDKCRVIQSNK